MNSFLFFSLHNLANQNDSSDLVIIFFADTLPYLVIIFTFLFLLFHHEVFAKQEPLKAFLQKWKEILFSFLVAITSLLVVFVLKNFFAVLRPFNAMEGVSNLFAQTGYAFPSGHATFFMALAFSVYLTHKKIGLILIFCAIFIGTARIMAGVHYPVDILGGFFLGVILAVLINFFFKRK